MQQIEIVNGQLTSEQIVKAVNSHRTKRLRDNLRYYYGDNPTIVDRVLPVVDAPNHKLPVSYARKIIRTIVGYMYKPGLITYSAEDERYLDTLSQIFRANNEDTKTSTLGRRASIQGAAYELHYTAGGPNPFFAPVPAENMIVLHNYSIEPDMVAAIRVYRKSDDGRNLEIYYPDRVDYAFLPDKQTDAPAVQMIGDEQHEYDDVPVVVYENNEEQLGDFEPIKSLIDAYDLLLSDSVNEFDRFAWAYLILKGMSMDPEDVDKMKQRRVIEVFAEGGEASFLQKDIPSDYIRFMSEWIRKEIHKQTHVPDFSDTTMGTEMTGAAIDRLFYDFEFVAADKEDRFRDALKRRINLVTTIVKKGSRGVAGDIDDVDITMSRNKPQMLSELAQTGQFYMGRVTDKTWLQEFAPFVENAEDELEAMEEETNPFRGMNANTGSTDQRGADSEEA